MREEAAEGKDQASREQVTRGGLSPGGKVIRKRKGWAQEDQRGAGSVHADGRE